MAEAGIFKYLSPQLADEISGLKYGVSKPMDGGRQGGRRSPASGSSVEFSEYRAYTPTDPIQLIDWTVYARTDHYVIKKFHDEVNVRAYILLDVSESMDYMQSGSMTKLEYACYLAAGLMYAFINQGDMVSLMLFDETISEQYPLASGISGIKPMLHALERINPSRKCNIERALHDAADRISGRALVIIISDLLEEPQSVIRGIQHLTHDKKEVTAFHVLDTGELRLPMEGLHEIEFLESRRKMFIDIPEIREKYIGRVNEYLNDLRSGFVGCGAEYVSVDTRDELRTTLCKRMGG